MPTAVHCWSDMWSHVVRGHIIYNLFVIMHVFSSIINDGSLLYAYDVLLYSYIKSESDCHALQEDLDALAQWARIWQMEFNPSKCEFLRVTNKKNAIVFNYCIEAVPIAQAAQTKYLGVTISEQPFME